MMNLSTIKLQFFLPSLSGSLHDFQDKKTHFLYLDNVATRPFKSRSEPLLEREDFLLLLSNDPASDSSGDKKAKRGWMGARVFDA